MKSLFHAVLRAHIINTSLYQPRDRGQWLKTTLMILMLGGVLVLLGMS